MFYLKPGLPKLLDIWENRSRSTFPKFPGIWGCGFPKFLQNLGKSGKDDFKGREVNKGRTELDNQKATIARVKENVHKRESFSVRTRALRWFRAHTQY